MRVRATCRHCGNDFHLHSLYNATGDDRADFEISDHSARRAGLQPEPDRRPVAA